MEKYGETTNVDENFQVFGHWKIAFFD